MAANTNDKASRVQNGGLPASAIVQADRSAGSTTLVLDTTTRWPTVSGIKFVTYRIDATTGKPAVGSQQDWAGTVSGTTITGLRKTSQGADAGNLTGDIAVMMPTGAWGDEFVQAFLAEHSNPDGHHSDVTATTLAVTGAATVGGSLTVGGQDVTQLTPAGSLIMFAGTTAPTGWKICDGSAVSRSTYSALFAIIGTTYGAGDGSTTFNLPNLKGKTPFGLDTGQAEFASLGQSGGQKTVQQHNHGVNDPGHSHTMWTVGQEANGVQLSYPSGSGRFVLNGGSPNSGNGNTGTSGSNISTQNAGSGSNNLNPYMTVNFIIKT